MSAPAYGIAPPGYRLPDETKLGRVRLQVADLGRSLRYYQDVLGLRPLEQGTDRAVLGPRGEDTPIVDVLERRGARPVPRRGLIGLYHYAILLPDRASLGCFVRHLGEIGAYAGMSDHFVSEAVYLTDPDGLGIEVYADRPRSSWRHENRQLHMTTAALDVDDLVGSAGSERWTGMPAGTRLGHVHLHVGDIDAAEAFYHSALGFDKVVWSYPGALFMSAGGYHHHLGTNTWAVGASLATEQDARLIDWEVAVPTGSDVRAAAESLRAAGYATEAVDSSVVARDPWGTAVRLVPAGS